MSSFKRFDWEGEPTELALTAREAKVLWQALLWMQDFVEAFFGPEDRAAFEQVEVKLSAAKDGRKA